MSEAIPNLLRPQQVIDLTDEKKKLERAASNPHLQDRGEVLKSLRRISSQLETQTPKPYSGVDLDQAVRREAELRAKLLEGMPSQEEMRKSPPGAVGKHMEWEKQNKRRLAEWKNLRLRINVGTSDPDVANFERYRPKDSTLGMQNALISGTQFHLPNNLSPAIIFSEDQLEFLRQHSPEIAEKLALLSNVQRQEVKELAEAGIGMAPVKKAKVKPIVKKAKVKPVPVQVTSDAPPLEAA